jgi:hypothetical protein
MCCPLDCDPKLKPGDPPPCYECWDVEDWNMFDNYKEKKMNIVWMSVLFLGSLAAAVMKLTGDPKPTETFISGWNTRERSWLINRAERFERDRLGE